MNTQVARAIFNLIITIMEVIRQFIYNSTVEQQRSETVYALI